MRGQRPGDRGFGLDQQALLVALHEEPESEAAEDHEGEEAEAEYLPTKTKNANPILFMVYVCQGS